MTMQAQTEAAYTVAADSVPADTVAAPVIRFGYLSYDEALKGMPEYDDAQQAIAREQEAYQQEMKRVEDEFNKKYEDFLDGQRDFPRTILLKRQNELQELMQQNIAFKEKARQELRDFEKRTMQPLRNRLNEALNAIAHEKGFALIINTDSNACPFIDPVMGMSIQVMVHEYLQTPDKK